MLKAVYFPQSGSENELFTFGRCMCLSVVNVIKTCLDSMQYNLTDDGRPISFQIAFLF